MTECSSCNIKENFENNPNDNPNDNLNDNPNETKEDFICAACIGAGFAAAGIGATAVGAKMKKQKYKTTKKIMLWSGIISMITALLLFIWAFIPKKYGGCRSCSK